MKLQQLLQGANGIESFLADVARYAAGAVEHALYCGLTVGATRASEMLGASSDNIGRPLTACNTTSTTARACKRCAPPAPCASTISPTTPGGKRSAAALNRPAPARRSRSRYGSTAKLSAPSTSTAPKRTDSSTTTSPAPTSSPTKPPPRSPWHLHDREDNARHLQTALLSRSTIEQAIGVLIAQTGVDPDKAFELLRFQSQHTNERLRVVAGDIVARAIRPR
jgi:hypothetical protein